MATADLDSNFRSMARGQVILGAWTSSPLARRMGDPNRSLAPWLSHSEANRLRTGLANSAIRFTRSKHSIIVFIIITTVQRQGGVIGREGHGDMGEIGEVGQRKGTLTCAGAGSGKGMSLLVLLHIKCHQHKQQPWWSFGVCL